jgi:glycosyltransferase involved in cell wall biosynthesis
VSKFISIVLPSRKRPKELTACIDSIYDNARDRSSFEVIVRVDDDDNVTAKIIPALEKRGVRVITGKRGRGYIEMVNFVDDATQVANTDWIWQLNDDGKIDSANWDDKMRECTKQFPDAILVPEIHRLGGSVYKNDKECPFMAYRKQLWDKMPHQCYVQADVIVWHYAARNHIEFKFVSGLSVLHDRDEAAIKNSLIDDPVTKQGLQ